MSDPSSERRQVRNEPVYNLIGGQSRDEITFYCTGPDALAIKAGRAPDGARAAASRHCGSASGGVGYLRTMGALYSSICQLSQAVRASGAVTHTRAMRNMARMR